MAAVPPEIERAAGLPLLDAALLLWLQRRALQRWDGKSSSPRLTGNPVSQIRQAIGALDVERARADNPGFLDASYEAAAQHLCMTMR